MGSRWIEEIRKPERMQRNLNAVSKLETSVFLLLIDQRGRVVYRSLRTNWPVSTAQLRRSGKLSSAELRGTRVTFGLLPHDPRRPSTDRLILRS